MDSFPVETNDERQRGTIRSTAVLNDEDMILVETLANRFDDTINSNFQRYDLRTIPGRQPNHSRRSDQEYLTSHQNHLQNHRYSY